MIKLLISGMYMSFNPRDILILILGLIIGLVSSCHRYQPPFNNFQLRNQAGWNPLGAIISAHNENKPHLIKQLQNQDIQFVEYGDTMTLIIPTDKYFMFMSPRVNDLCYPGLVNIVRLLKLYPQSPIYVAGFTDNVGSRRHKRNLSQAQAETMLTFLWANGIHAMRLKAEGYGDKNNVSNNKLIHGSAQNRRIEIQWFTGLLTAPTPIRPLDVYK